MSSATTLNPNQGHQLWLTVSLPFHPQKVICTCLLCYLKLSPKPWQAVQPFQLGHTGSQNHGKNPPSLAFDFNRLTFHLPSLWKDNFVVFHMIPQGVPTWIYLQLPTMIACSSMHPFTLLMSSLLLSLTISQTTYTQGLPLGSTFRRTQRHILDILCLF